MSEETKPNEGQEPVTNALPAEKGRGLFVKTISVTYERKFNLATGQPLDNYESAHLGFTCWADREEGSDIEQDLAALWKLAKAQVKAQALPMLKTRNEKRRKLAETRKAAKPRQAVQPPAPAAAAPPPAPTQAAPPPPPATGVPPAPEQAAAPASTINKVTVEPIDQVRVTMPTDKSRVEFWRAGRKYPEVHWGLGGEPLMEIAPTLVAAGWTAEHFDAVGAKYQLNLLVSWIPSPKDAKYKDITKVVLVQEA